MWVVRWVVFALVVICVLIFALENIGTPPLRDGLSLKFLGHQTPEWPVFLWLILAFFFGVFFFMAIAIVREVKIRAEMGRLKHELSLFTQDGAEDEFEELDGEDDNRLL